MSFCRKISWVDRTACAKTLRQDIQGTVEDHQMIGVAGVKCAWEREQGIVEREVIRNRPHGTLYGHQKGLD